MGTSTGSTLGREKGKSDVEYTLPIPAVPTLDYTAKQCLDNQIKKRKMMSELPEWEQKQTRGAGEPETLWAAAGAEPAPPSGPGAYP